MSIEKENNLGRHNFFTLFDFFVIIFLYSQDVQKKSRNSNSNHVIYLYFFYPIKHNQCNTFTFRQKCIVIFNIALKKTLLNFFC